MAITYSPNWTNIYDCSVLPQNANPAWTVSTTSMFTLSNGQLRIYDNSTTTYGSTNISNIINPSNIITLEANTKIVSASNVNAVGMQITDGNLGITIGLQTNKINVVDSFTGAIVKNSCNIDLSSKFNNIKLIKYGTAKYEVYVNDTIVLNGTEFDTGFTYNRLGWGAISTPGTSDSYWQYIRYCTNGIPKPCKFLIQDKNNILYTYGAELDRLQDTTISDTLFLNKGTLDPTLINNKNAIQKGIYMKDMGTLGAGKYYSFSLDEVFKKVNNIV